MSVTEQLEEVRTKLAVLTEKVEQWMDTTNSYRKALCDKLDVVNEKLNDLPCKERRVLSNNIEMQIKALWGFVVMIITAIVYEWIRKT